MARMGNGARRCVIALEVIAAAVTVMQAARWPWAWLFVTAYWAVLLLKNDFDRRGK